MSGWANSSETYTGARSVEAGAAAAMEEEAVGRRGALGALGIAGRERTQDTLSGLPMGTFRTRDWGILGSGESRLARSLQR